jgi:hypothetical protein
MCRTYKTSSSLGAVAAPFHSLSHFKNKLRRQPRSLLKYSKLPLRPLRLHLKHQQFLYRSPRRCHSRQARLLLVAPLRTSPCISQMCICHLYIHQIHAVLTILDVLPKAWQCAVHQVFHFSLALAPDSGSMGVAVFATSLC